eukprot:scaffold2671_cov252-Pinguiococcus_pyrenoidosus.AAC.14
MVSRNPTKFHLRCVTLAPWVSPHQKKRHFRRRSSVRQPWVYSPSDGEDSVTWADCSTEPEPMPGQVERRPYWRMRVVRESILNGRRLTPHVFVPREVWVQIGYKAAGLTHKQEAIIRTTEEIARSVSPYADAENLELNVSALLAVKQLRGALHDIQETLHTKFAHIPAPPEEAEGDEDDDDDDDEGDEEAKDAAQAEPPVVAAPAATTETDSFSRLGISRASISGLSSKLRSAVGAAYTMGVTMASGAAAVAHTTRERLAAAVPSHTTVSEMEDFKTYLCELCEKSQVLDTWLLACEKRLLRSDSVESDTFDDKGILLQIRGELCAISTFMEDVMNEVIFREMNALLARYVNKVCKSFASMYFDEVFAEEDSPVLTFTSDTSRSATGNE